MSVGHAARAIEEVGIPTVMVLAAPFKQWAVTMHVPRALITPHISGRPFGAPGDKERQRSVISAALELLESAGSNATIADFPGKYRPAPQQG